MAPPPPFSLGPAEVQPAPPPPPLAPTILDSLLCHDPARAAAILAAMRPAARAAQAHAHAHLCGVGVESVRAEWGALIAGCPRPPLARPPRNNADDAPYDPEILALLEPAAAQDLIAALSPDQRDAQAAAQAAWLGAFGYPVAVEDILGMWATHSTDTN
ncbi:hypothetical protein K2Z83_27625 [Oscillochloris sp. ZM17-4]|uniref:hypothetical protein n=1 Tax=Oscillochloris sp. ZM17-4 TaxID=2866714 RepID=UPI001C737A53|nr:hypothetical protein [Oscillochloris sp. ZM17-4]MBX0331427.1 hypothetical protein [Oscillochloris sp. ZM17-4]